MKDITIRAAQPRDIPTLRAINEAGRPGVVALTPGELAALAAGTMRCWVAQTAAGGDIAGYLITYTADEDYDGEEFAWFQRHFTRFLYVDEIAIAADQRRSGLGAALFRAATDFARAHDLIALTCEVNLDPPNPISLRFHQAQGFEQVGTLDTQDGRTVALLRCSIQPPETDTSRTP